MFRRLLKFPTDKFLTSLGITATLSIPLGASGGLVVQSLINLVDEQENRPQPSPPNIKNDLKNIKKYIDATAKGGVAGAVVAVPVALAATFPVTTTGLVTLGFLGHRYGVFPPQAKQEPRDESEHTSKPGNR